MASQENASFSEALDRCFMDGESKYEVGDSDDGWEPDSHITEEEESKLVLESNDNTAVLTLYVSFFCQMFHDPDTNFPSLSHKITWSRGSDLLRITW